MRPAVRIGDLRNRVSFKKRVYADAHLNALHTDQLLVRVNSEFERGGTISSCHDLLPYNGRCYK